MKFEIGDKVIHNRFGKGIVKVFPKNCKGGVGVEFEQESILFHDLFHDGRPYAKLHHGYWVMEDDLIKDGKQEENMIRFKVGDRVKHDSYGLGIVEEVNMNLALPYCILFDNGDFALCSNAGLTKIKPPKETIVIKRDGDTVTAYMGKKQAVAKCSPKDTFDLYKGSILALTRLLLEGEENGGGKEL